jgi:dTDP-4-amino-4,6-dideoxygalactose transaminase
MQSDPAEVTAVSPTSISDAAEGANSCSPGFARSNFLAFSPPSIGEEEISEVVDTLRSGWITTGPKSHRFEAEFAAMVGAPAALGVNSCTAALHTSLATLGIGPGDEVITTALTFAATVSVIHHVGATPVLVDVEPDTLNISPGAIAAALSPRTRAILPVHYGGHPADLDPIGEMASAVGATVVEDAAHALIACYRGRVIGAGPNPVAFSFYATKNLTTGEGGMLTGDGALIEQARIWSLHGMSRDAWRRYTRAGSWRYEVVVPGFKCNMTDIQAAMGLAQLRKLDGFQSRRRAIAAAYTAAFRELDALEVPTERSDVQSAWHLYVLRLNPSALRIGRDRFIDELSARNIGTSVHFIPIYRHPFYRDCYGLQPTMFPITESNYRRMLSLPLHPLLSDQDVADVIDAVRDVVIGYRR